MPRKSKNFKSNKKRVNKKAKRNVKSYPKQIQNASFLPKSRLIKFTDFRSYVVTDEGFNATGALPPQFQICANNPGQFAHNHQGTWDATSLTSKGASVHGVTTWIAPTPATSSDTAPYLKANCLSCKVTVTATPLPTYSAEGEEHDAYQDVIKLCVQPNTRLNAWKDRNIDNQFNSEVLSQTPYVRTANMYYNANGTPRGATITQHYSYKKFNMGRPARDENNFFGPNHVPLSQEWINVGLMPVHSQKYSLSALGGTRLPNCRVEIKVSYICLLSEPNTHTGTHMVNQGNDLVSIPTLDVPNTPIKMSM